MSKPFTARPLLTVLALALVVMGMGLLLARSSFRLGQDSSAFLLPVSVPSTPNERLLSADLAQGALAQAPSVDCGSPVRTAFRSDSGSGWYNYAPNSGVLFAPGGPPPEICRGPAQRRVALGAGAMLIGLAGVLVSRRATRALPV